MKHKKVFIVITHIKTPNEIYEKCEFVSELKKTHITDATVIVDFLKERIEKDRTKSETYNSIIRHVTNNYPQQMAELNVEYKNGKDNPD